MVRATLRQVVQYEAASLTQVILEAVQKGEPTAFFCKLGKDRTGIISMLVLSCCGATEGEIVSDYIRWPSYSLLPLSDMYSCPTV
jgi:protein tyrosine/serine phosphatase